MRHGHGTASILAAVLLASIAFSASTPAQIDQLEPGRLAAAAAAGVPVWEWAGREALRLAGSMSRVWRSGNQPRG